MRVAVIGAGGIGTRHLQSLRLLPTQARIEIYDPVADRLKTALGQLNGRATPAEHEIVSLGSMDGLSAELDVAIIATTADARLEALEAVLERAAVKHVILEKFLFQSTAAFDRAAEVLELNGAQAWVNTPRRLWPSYRRVREAFADDVMVSCRASASHRLAVGMSAVHFLDTLAYVTGNDRFQLHGDRLVLAPQVSRRPGHSEFCGSIYGSSPDGGGFEYTAYLEGNAPLLVELSSPYRRYLIREADGIAWYAEEESGWEWTELPFEVMVQSELTHGIVEELVETGRCDLPTFEMSRVVHEQILSVLLDAYRESTGEYVDACPIT